MNSSFSFAGRTDWLVSTNALTQAYESLKEEGAPVIDLTESNPTYCGFDYPDEVFQALSLKENESYQPSPRGMVRAREAVCAYYERKGRNVRPDQVVLTSSTSEAYSFLFRLLADPHDHVLFPSPSYPLFQFLADLNDIHLDRYSLTYKERWMLDMKGIKSKLKWSTRAVAVVNPNNPTGSYLDESGRKELNKILKEYGTPIISDEVFFDYAFKNNHPSQSLVGNEDVLTFVLGGVSKTLGLPQMKLSWIVISGPDPVCDEALQKMDIIADTYLSVGTPSQNAFPVWVEHMDNIQGQIIKRVRENRRFLAEQCAKIKSCQLLGAEGGWYAVLRIPRVKSEEAWGLKLLQKYHVFVHPGYFYDFAEEGFLVVSLLVHPGPFQEGIQRIVSRLEQEIA